MKPYVIGMDIGTTCAKALAVAPDGSILCESSRGYKIISAGSHVEQNPQDWIDAAKQIFGEITGRLRDMRPVALSFSTQGGTTAAVDADGGFIGNALTWMDSRAAAEADEIAEELGGDYIYHTSGWRINPALDPSKIRHMKRAGHYDRAAQYLSTLEIMNGYLTGRPAVDPTNAAMRQLLDINTGDWCDALVRAAGITRDELPEILPTGAYVGGITARAARETGLPEGMPVYNGVHDQYSASIGAGAVRDGDLLLSGGTTWVLIGIGNTPVFTGSYAAPGRHPQEGLYGTMASLVCSGASLQWYVDGFMDGKFDEINRIVPERMENTKELFFYPYMTGAYYPIWNVKARGAFVGLGMEHDRFDMARAIMEGSVFGLKRALEDFRRNGMQAKRILIMGGVAKSDPWCRMIADACDMPVERLNVADICCVGAVNLALKGAGICESLDEAARLMTKPGTLFTPDETNRDYYDGKYARAEKMWGCMAQYYEK